jgi:hypothetical protein
MAVNQEYLTLAITSGFSVTATALRKLSEGEISLADDRNFQLQGEIEPEYQLMKSYIRNGTVTEQLLESLRVTVPATLYFLAKVTEGTQFYTGLETATREIDTITDEDIVKALEMARSTLSHLIDELEVVRTH